MAPFLEVKNLTHIYSAGTPFEHKALDDVSFWVDRGEFIGVIGHTGSGKSTLMQHLNGLLKPDSGTITLGGEDIWKDKTILEKLDFIANGDMAEIIRVHGTEEMYGFRFADVTLSLIDYEDCEIDVKIMLDTLTSESPSLTREENEKLFTAVWEDYPEIRSKRKRMEEIRKNPYYNALQVKYGYAVTCHKAQGGEWKRVFIDQGYLSEDMVNPDYYRWLYTAFTRASEKLHLVNWKVE